MNNEDKNKNQINFETEIEDEFIHIKISNEDRQKYKRLDQFLVSKIENMSRSFIKNIFQEGLIGVLENNTTKNIKLELKKMPSSECTLEIHLPPPTPTEASAENIPLEILFEDEHLMIINKPSGMVTHPAPGNYTGTLVNAVLWHAKDLKGIGNKLRPGIVHRLDKGTSGVMVVAKSQPCHEKLVMLFSKHDIDRVYYALAMGQNYTDAGSLESFIGRHPHNRKKMAVTKGRGKRAVTHYTCLKRFEKCSLLKLKLETGRTHQIRVHLSSLLRAPILCDATYGNPKEHLSRVPSEVKNLLENYPHPLLHAKILGFTHPITNEKLYFESDLPSPFKETIELLEQSNQ